MLALADERSGDPANSGRGCQVSDKLAIGAARDCHATGGNMAAISKSQAELLRDAMTPRATCSSTLPMR